MNPSRSSMAARSSGPRFLLSNGTMHQATRLSRAKSRVGCSAIWLGALPGRSDRRGILAGAGLEWPIRSTRRFSKVQETGAAMEHGCRMDAIIKRHPLRNPIDWDAVCIAILDAGLSSGP